MNRIGLVALAGVLASVPLLVAACGSGDDSASATLPPILTTTSTTIVITTSTEWVPSTYVIQSGDGLKNIAEKFGVDVDELAVLNGITNKNAIEAGDVLNLPPPTTPTTTVAPTTTG